MMAKRVTSIQWDEETIAEHDKERGTRQKIDEPPTPYNYDQGQDPEDPTEFVNTDIDISSSSGVVSVASPVEKKASEVDLTSVWGSLHAKLSYYEHAQQTCDATEGRGQNGVSPSEATLEDGKRIYITMNTYVACL